MDTTTYVQAAHAYAEARRAYARAHASTLYADAALWLMFAQGSANITNLRVDPQRMDAALTVIFGHPPKHILVRDDTLLYCAHCADYSMHKWAPQNPLRPWTCARCGRARIEKRPATQPETGSRNQDSQDI